MLALSHILGDPLLAEGQKSGVPSYEELHAEAQSILVPPSIQAGVQVNVVSAVPLAAVPRSLALSGRLFLANEKREGGPLAALSGGGGGARPPGAPPSRIAGLGAIWASRFRPPWAVNAESGGSAGGAARIFAQIDSSGLAKTTALLALPLPQRARGATLGLAAQAAWPRGAASPAAGLAATLRGADFTAVARLTDGPDVGFSYLQRLAAGSPLSLGGEMWLSVPAMSAAARAAPGTAESPLHWAVGGALEGTASRTGVHLSNAGGGGVLLFNVQHLLRVSDRAALVAKLIVDTRGTRSMAAAGYRLQFRSTGTEALGMADTYGGVRLRVDRELMPDVRAAFFLHYNAGATGSGAPDDPNSFGVKFSVGKQPTLDAPFSPCTMNREVFRIQ